MHTYIHPCMNAYIHRYTDIYIHRYIHTDIHTYTYIRAYIHIRIEIIRSGMTDALIYRDSSSRALR